MYKVIREAENKKTVDYKEYNKEVYRLQEELHNFCKKMGFRGSEVSIGGRAPLDSINGITRLQVNWSAIGSVNEEEAAAFAKVLTKAANMAITFKYKDYEVDYSMYRR